MIKPMKRWLFVLDPLDSLNLKKDSSYAMMQSMHERGDQVAGCEIGDLSVLNGQVHACWRQVDPRAREGKPHLEISQSQTGTISDSFDAVWIRKDPPVDEAYVWMTQILDLLPSWVPVFNPTRALRDFNEKLSTFNFSEFQNQIALVSKPGHVEAAIANFSDQVVIKPLGLFGGQGIERVETKSLDQVLSVAAQVSNHWTQPVIVQDFLKRVHEGDKRVTMIAGEVGGVVLRLPKAGSWKANLMQGGGFAKTSLTEREIEACRQIGEFLTREHILLAGLDFVGECLNEINITSPTCFPETKSVSGVDLAELVVDAASRAVESHTR